MTGRHQGYNARSRKDGTQICGDCLTDEIYEELLGIKSGG